MTGLRKTMLARAFGGVAVLGVALGGLSAAQPAAAQSVEQFMRALRTPLPAPQLRNMEETPGPSPAPEVGIVQPVPAPPPLVNTSGTVCGRDTDQIGFRFNSAELDERHIHNVANLATALNAPENRALRVLLVGHTDGVGSDEYNLDLSRRRADSVREYLITRGGVSAARITTDGQGKRQLLRPDDPTHASNRRVAIRTFC